MKSVNLFKFIFLCLISVVLVVIAFVTSYETESNNLEVTFIDVGQGDCVYIKTPDNFRMLIDAGDKGSYEKYLKKFFARKRIKALDVAVVTHFNSDHFYGFAEILGKKRIDNVYVPYGSEGNLYSDYLYQACIENKCNYEYIKGGYKIYEGEDGVKIFVMFPSDFVYKRTEETSENNNSIVILLEYSGRKFLFMSDIEEEAEKAIANFFTCKADVLKVGHHGSNTSSSDYFLSEVLPEYSVISCGKNNSYGFPDMRVLERLRRYNSKIYRTDESGNIQFIVDKKGEININTSK